MHSGTFGIGILGTGLACQRGAQRPEGQQGLFL